MMELDPKTGKLRPTSAVRFSQWVVLVGCLVGGTVTGAVLLFTLLTGPGVDELAPASSVLKGVLLVMGAAVAIFLFAGPPLAYGLSFMLRGSKNQNVHVLAFAVLGLIVGFSLGTYIGAVQSIDGFASIAAPATGIGAAVGRWSISRHAKI